MRGSFIAGVVAFGLLGAAGVAVAQPEDDDGEGQLSDADKEQAKQHYMDAEEAMSQGDYALAARQYAIAYEYTKDPLLFYKIANAHDRAGDCDAAIVYYRRYLREANPSEEWQRTTNERVEACNAKLGNDTGGGDAGGGDTGDGDGDIGAGGDADTGTAGGVGSGVVPPDDTTVPPVGTPPSFEDEGASWQKTAGWVSVGATVAFAAVGAVLGLSASSREEDLENLLRFRDADGNPAVFDGQTRERYEELLDEGDDLDRFSKIAFGAAGASAAAALVFFILDATSSSGESATQAGRVVAPTVGDRSVGVSAAWSF